MTDILEILTKEARSKWALVYEHDGWIKDAAKEIKRLRKDLSSSDNLSYQERIERLEKAADAALDWIESAEHKFDCPRNRDDYDCTCGRDEVIQQLYGAFDGSQ